MKKMNRWLALALALVMVLGLAACGSTADSSANGQAGSAAGNQAGSDAGNQAGSPAGNGDGAGAAPAGSAGGYGEAMYGGSINLYYTNDIDTNFDQSIGDNCGWNLWMESLFTYDVNASELGFACTGNSFTRDQLVGRIASGYDWDEAAKTITVYIRDNVYFQDKAPFNGRQLTAEDVKWSYDRIMGTGSGFTAPYVCTNDWMSFLNNIASVEVVNEFTVQFNCTELNELLLERFLSCYLNISGPEWDTLSEDEKADWHNACGTGPYIMTGFVSGQSVTFTRNENYYGVDNRAGYEGNQLPYIDEVSFVHITDSTNAVTQFSAGELDYIGGRSNVLSDSEIAQLNASGVAYNQFTCASNRVEYIAIRCNCEPFNDARLREAVQHAIDLEAIATDYYGYDAVTYAGLTEGGHNYSTDEGKLAAAYAYDPDLTKQLMAEAGCPNGFEFTVVISPDSDADLYNYVAAAYLAPLGIIMNIEQVSNFMESKSIGNTEDDTRSTGGTGALGGTVTYRVAARTYTCAGGWGYSLWHGDDAWEKMVSDAEAITNVTDLQASVKELSDYFIDQHWFVCLSGALDVSEFMSARVSGLANTTRFYNPSLIPAFVTHMWVTDAQ